MIPLAYSVRSILRRRFTALATAGGLGLVVFVFAAVLMLARGVELTLTSTGSRQNAIVLRKGSSAEATSFVTHDAVRIIEADPAVATYGGKAVVSPELFVVFQLPRGDGRGVANVAFRGVTPDGYELLRAQAIPLLEGRAPRPGTSEVMIGRGVRGRFTGAELGGSIRIARREWRVVGVFGSNGSAFESEIWAEADQLGQAAHRTGYSSVTLRLARPSDLDRLASTLGGDPRQALEAKHEDEYYAESSGPLAAFIRVLGTSISVFFSIGAILGAMITMNAQVASRVREVGSLRALGFRRRAVLAGFLVESVILAGLGAVAGCLLAASLGAVSFSTTNFSSYSELVLRFHFAPDIALASAVFAVTMGVLGGLLPAWRAARLTVAEAIRG